MKENELFNLRGCLTLEALQALANKQLNTENSQKANQHIKECPLCADAMEGLQLSNNSSAIVEELKSNIVEHANQPKIGSTKTGKRFMVLSLAASVALILGIYFLLPADGNGYIENLAVESPQDNLQPPLPDTNFHKPFEPANEDGQMDENTTKKLGAFSSNEDKTPYNEVFTFTDEMPEFPGGIVALNQYIEGGVKQAEQSMAFDACGTVLVNFVVTEQGEISQPKVVDGHNPKLDKAALKVIENLPNWKPGRQSGQKVKVAFTLPIRFNNC